MKTFLMMIAITVGASMGLNSLVGELISTAQAHREAEVQHMDQRIAQR